MPERDHEIETILRHRHSPATPPDLTARIIARAQALPQQEKGRFFKAAWQEIAEMFLLPRPAYALSAVLVLSLLAGSYAGSLSSSNMSDLQQEWQVFAYAEEESI